MKLGTIVKVGALAVAAGSTAVGTVLLTTKALGKVGTKNENDIPQPETPVVNKPYSAAPEFEAAPAMPFAAAPVVEEPAPAPVFEAAPVIPEPVVEEIPAAPVVEPVFAAPAEEPVASIEVELPTIEAPVIPEPVAPVIPEPVVAEIPMAAPIVEPVAPAEPESAPYQDLGYQLPYLAGNLGNNEDLVEKVETPIEAAAPVIPEPVAPAEPEPAITFGTLPATEEVVEPVDVTAEPVEEAPVISEPIAPELPVVEPVVEAPIAEPIVEAPVVEPIVEPIAEPIAVEPEVVIRQAEPVAEDLFEAPIMDVEPVAAPVEENPLAEGFTVSMHEEPSDALPIMGEATFEDLPVASDYVEPIAAEEPVAEAPVVEVAEENLPVDDFARSDTIEASGDADQPSAPTAGKEAKIGDAIVSDKASNPNIAAVSAKFRIPVANLVSIEAEGNMPMVFEFLYDDMKNDATLVSVYFIMNGEATLPPEADREGVLAFGRNFITGNDELKAFLA